jgi:hypothetical protein
LIDTILIELMFFNTDQYTSLKLLKLMLEWTKVSLKLWIWKHI